MAWIKFSKWSSINQGNCKKKRTGRCGWRRARPWNTDIPNNNKFISTRLISVHLSLIFRRRRCNLGEYLKVKSVFFSGVFESGGRCRFLRSVVFVGKKGRDVWESWPELNTSKERTKGNIYSIFFSFGELWGLEIKQTPEILPC